MAHGLSNFPPHKANSVARTLLGHLENPECIIKTRKNILFIGFHIILVILD